MMVLYNYETTSDTTVFQMTSSSLSSDDFYGDESYGGNNFVQNTRLNSPMAGSTNFELSIHAILQPAYCVFFDKIFAIREFSLNAVLLTDSYL